MGAKLYRCINVKDNDPNPRLYFLENKYGEIVSMTKEQIKEGMRKGSILCENLKLTKDGKLIQCKHTKERNAIFLEWLRSKYPKIGSASDNIVLCSSFGDSLKIVIVFIEDNIKVIKYRFESPMRPIIKTTLFDANSCKTLNEFEHKIDDLMVTCKGVNLLNTKDRIQRQLKLVENHIMYLQEEQQYLQARLKEMENK